MSKEKIGRNQLCPCESGRKYKNCCMNKEDDKKGIVLNSSDLLSVLETGLKNAHLFNPELEPHQIKEVKLFNNKDVECKFCPYSTNSIDVKLEIGSIMAFMYSFLNEKTLRKFDIRNFAVRAFDKNKEEILYAISSYEVASQISKGNSIEWLKGTLFQDNTSDYRLSIAKRQISEIEKSLRVGISRTLAEKYGANWWDTIINTRIRNKVSDHYFSQFQEYSSDGSVLIEYTYVLDLKKIICTNWTDFKHLFTNKTQFENAMDNFNILRREEAHNRDIKSRMLNELKNIYTQLLIKIPSYFPDIIPHFLIDNWRNEIKTIVTDTYKPLFDEDELLNEKEILLKLTKLIANTNHMIKYLQNIEDHLNSVIVPIQKQELHNELVQTFVKYRILHEQMIIKTNEGDLQSILETVSEVEQYKVKMDDFSKKFLLSEG